jgi:hypothetical protein
VIEFVAACGFFLLALVVMGIIADALGEPERWDSRRRNGR